MRTKLGVSAVLALAAVMMGGSVAYARLEANQQANVAMDIPDNWTMQARGGRVVVMSPDENMLLEVQYVTQANQFAEMRQEFERQLTTRFVGLRWEGEPINVQQHGMRGAVRRGSGRTQDGRDIAFSWSASRTRPAERSAWASWAARTSSRTGR